MITNPIIPIWIMAVICIIWIVLIVFSKRIRKAVSKSNDTEKTKKQTKLLKEHIIECVIKTLIVVLIFIINLRIMIPNGETTAINLDLSVLFVIDTSVSMRALDYNGSNERFDAVRSDCSYIIDELSGAKFAIITFGDTARKLVPFTTDNDMVKTEIKSINLESDYYAGGTSLNTVKDVLEKTLKDEMQKQNGSSKSIVFFISDGEITKEGEKLTSFSSIKNYVSNGAVMGYGTLQGGKMLDSSMANEISYTGEPFYLEYRDDEGYSVPGVSKLDEENLKSIATDLGIDYIKMNKSSDIASKINEVKRSIQNAKNTEEKVKTYQDIYYYFAIPLVLLVIIEFILQKRRLT